MEQWMPNSSTNRNDKSFLSLNSLEVKYYDEISQERHKSMTPKCGCVTIQQFSCSVISSGRVILITSNQQP
jgi:hypothetical protein